jgi:hypothetical protein
MTKILRLKLKKKEKITRAYRKLSPEHWEQIKWLWIKNYPNENFSFKSLASQFPPTTESDVKAKSKTDDWRGQRNDWLATTKEKIFDSMVNMFTAANLPPQKLIDLIASSSVETRKLQNVKKFFGAKMIIGKKGNKIFRKAYSIDETIEVVDNGATFQYRQLAAELMGLKKKGEQEGNKDGDGDTKPKTNIHIYIPDNQRPLTENPT